MLLLLLAAASASAFAQPKHVPQQGQIVETHTEYGAGSCLPFARLLPQNRGHHPGRRAHPQGNRRQRWRLLPGKLDSGITVTVDFEKNPELWIVDGGTRLELERPGLPVGHSSREWLSNTLLPPRQVLDRAKVS